MPFLSFYRYLVKKKILLFDDILECHPTKKLYYLIKLLQYSIIVCSSYFKIKTSCFAFTLFHAFVTVVLFGERSAESKV